MSVSDALQSTGVILPDDLVDDDTLLIYMSNGRWTHEVSPEQLSTQPKEFEFSSIQHQMYLVNLALEYYNGKHQSDYKVLTRNLCDHVTTCCYARKEDYIHTSFEAAVGNSPPNYFCTKIWMDPRDNQRLDVASCEIANGDKPIDCKKCTMWAASYPPTDSPIIGPPLSDYRHILTDGVTLSDKAKHRLEYTLPALKHYNSENRTDYKLVDALPQSFVRKKEKLVGHMNFIAKLNGGSKNELFFAEIKRSKPDDSFEVTDCHILSGKTEAGCPNCISVMGKRVIHPTGKRIRSSSTLP